jgi:hypothetical protein
MQETDSELLAALRRLIIDGHAKLKLDYARLDQIDSPVAVEADSNIWAYGGILVTIAAGWRGGMTIGIIAAAVSVAAYYTAGKLYVHRRLERRVRERALQEAGLWRRLWRRGGIELVVDDDRCVAPDGNWMELVRRKCAGAPSGAN